MNLKPAHRGLSLILATLMVFSCFSLALPPAKAAGDPSGVVYLGRDVYNIEDVTQSGSSEAAMNASPGLADFTRPGVIDYIHYATRSDANDGIQGVPEVKYVKADVSGNRVDISGSDGSSWKGNYNGLGIFSPKYTDGTVLNGDGSVVDSTGNLNLRTSTPCFYGNGATATYTAPSANGETRTLEIYLAANGGENITTEATMGNTPITVSAFNRAEEDKVTQGNQANALRYVFSYTGDEEESPLVVKFTLNYNNDWAGLKPVAACILEGGVSDLTVTGGTARYQTPFTTPNADAPQDKYVSGRPVTIAAEDAAFGKVFAGWTGSDEDMALLNNTASSSTATFTMPGRDVSLTATYEEADKKTVRVTGGTAKETSNPEAPEGETISAYEGSTITLTANEPAEGEKFQNWNVISGVISLAAPGAKTTSFVMPDENVEIAANFAMKGTATPGIKQNTDPVVGTKKYNEYLSARWSVGEPMNQWSATTAFSDVSSMTQVAGVPQIDDNLSASNVLDWIRFTNSGSGAKENRRVGENMLTASFEGYVNNERKYASYEERKNVRLSYFNGTSPAEDSSSYCVVRTGNATATFTAPSSEGIERTLDVYLTFMAWDDRVLTIKATMPKQGGGTYTYNQVEIMPAQSAVDKISGRYVAKFSIAYVGDAEEKPLTVKFSLGAGNGDMGVYGARLTEGVPEAQIYMTVPDLTTEDKYAITVPGSLFQRRCFPTKVVDSAGELVDAPVVTYSYEGASENVKGLTDIPGIAIEPDGMLYVYPEAEESMTISVIASAVVDGKNASAMRSVRIVKDEHRHDMPIRAAEEGPLGKDADDWAIYFNDDFDGPELDTTAWIPQNLQGWTKNKDLSEALYEMVQDETGNGYLALGAKEQQPDFTEIGDQPCMALVSRDRHHQHLLEKGRDNALDPDLPDFDTPVTTKYGYFETRMRLPSTGDGGHFAWWMVGAQDDSHPTQALSGPAPTNTEFGKNGIYGFGPGGWGNYASYTSDQGVEYDILESTLDKNGPSGNSPYNQWLPVQHKNGSRSFPTVPAIGRWWSVTDMPNGPYGQYNYSTHTEDGYENGRDAYQEFHVYGFEWDETGTKMYIDGHLVYASPRTADYRMLTLLSVYLGRNGDGDGYGYDHGYWPKEAMFDYFRIYKKATPVPTSIVINGLKDGEGEPIQGRHNTSWDYFQQNSTVELSATVLDQFGKPYDMSLLPESVSLQWRFSDDIGGSAPLRGGTVKLIGNGNETDLKVEIDYPATYSSTAMTGLALDPITGVVTVADDAPVMDQDVFLTVYLADSTDDTGYYGGKFTVSGEAVSNENLRNRAKYQETKHIKISDEEPKAHRVFFDDPILTIAPGETLSVKATVYDQYNNPMPSETLRYVLSKDVTLRESVNLSGDGITLSGSSLAAAWNATQGKQIMVRAQLNDDVYQNLALKVEGEQGEPPYIPPTSNSGSGSSTTNEKNKDGSTTKTVSDKKTGMVTATTTYPDGTKIVATTPKDGNTSIEVTVPKDKEKVTITIPTAEKPKSGEVAVIILGDGTREVVKTSVSAKDGLRVTLTGNAKLEIVDNSKSFADVAEDNWAADAVQFAASRELFTGTGKDSFSPAADMSRAMLVTVLARLDGVDTKGGDTWYAMAADWAKTEGITDGAGLDDAITRESLAVMLYRYAKAEKIEADLKDFSDADSVSGWAAEAMSWAVANGILTGKSGHMLDPTGNASRAEVAAMLQRFIAQ